MKEDTPSIKRFKTHSEAFTHFLKVISYEDSIKRVAGKKTRIALYLKEILEHSAKRFPWKKEEGKEVMVVKTAKDTYFKISLSYADILYLTTWENMDFIIRQVNAHNSGLPKRLRDVVMYVLNWIEHFVGEGEVNELNIE